MAHPLVSVVTPFYNTAPFLPQCIESVLGQSFADFEYILVDNCSTDGSGDIAESYAQRDSRIRVVHRSALLPQVQNYNAALTEISAASEYCKIVQADDYIFPDCLKLMVREFEKSPAIGLVSAYDIRGNVIRASGFPVNRTPMRGVEAARLYFRTGVFFFGSPTSVMYRASLVREQVPFYKEGLLHEDTEKCFEILEKWDLGFVPQVLAFIRTSEDSISGTVRDLAPNALDRYILVQRFASTFLPAAEAHQVKEDERRDYYAVLAHAALRRRDETFWQYHLNGLKTAGETIDRGYLFARMLGALLQMILNPGTTISRLFSHRKPVSPAEAPTKNSSEKTLATR